MGKNSTLRRHRSIAKDCLEHILGAIANIREGGPATYIILAHWELDHFMLAMKNLCEGGYLEGLSFEFKKFHEEGVFGVLITPTNHPPA